MEASVSDQIYACLEEASTTGKISPQTIGNLDALRQELGGLELFWLKNDEKEIKSTFVMYHGARNCRIIVEEMMEAFKNAAEEGHNPIVADYAIMVLPSIFDLQNLLEALKTLDITKQLQEKILVKTRELRDVAQKVNMLPSGKKELETVPKEKAKKAFSLFADKIQAMLVEVQGNP